MSNLRFPDEMESGDYFPSDRQDRTWAPGLAIAGDAKSALYRCNFVVALRREVAMREVMYGDPSYMGRSVSVDVVIDSGSAPILDLDADAIAAQRVVRAIAERPDASLMGDLVFSTVYRYLQKAMKLRPHEVLHASTSALQSFMDVAAEEVGGTAVQIDARGSHVRRDSVEIRVVIRVDAP